MMPQRIYSVWLRHMMVWRKYYKEAIIGTTGEPIIYLLALGYGIGHYIGNIDGVTYIQYIAPGLWMSSAMNAASVESTYGAYTRLSTQKTYDAILATPLNTYEIIAGDILFATTRSFVNCTVILIVFAIAGLLNNPLVLLIPLLGLITGLFFACFAMTVTAISHGYEFFVYYFTLFVTPMFMLSGIFFPIEHFPDWLEKVSWWIPLTQIVAISRGLFLGKLEVSYLFSSLYIIVLSLVFYFIAAKLFHKRLIK